MQKLTCVAIAAVLFFLGGCSESSTPSNPQNGQNIVETETSSSGVASRRAPITFIKLPASAEPRIEKYVSARISPLLGGTIPIEYSYQKANGGRCSITAKLVVPPLALLHDETITVALDTVNAAVRFEPEGLTFLVPCLLDYSVTGLEAQPLGLAIGLYYVDNNGIPTKMPTGGISVNISAGSLGLRLGVIPHFSRYIFGRVTDR